MIDQPEYSISELVALTDRIKGMTDEQKKAEIAKFSKDHPSPHQRLFLGRSADKSVALRLKDPEGHDRVVLEVAADGSPVLQFLDDNGKVISQMPPKKP